MGRAIARGLLRTALRKDPDRLRRLIIALDQRIRGEGVRVPEEGVETLRWLRSQDVLLDAAASIAAHSLSHPRTPLRNPSHLQVKT